MSIDDKAAIDPTKTLMRSYGRVKARALKPKQADLMTTLLPNIALEGPGLSAVLDEIGKRPIFLEIGFGGGEHMAQLALANPEALILGCEPFLNGVGSALRHIDELGINNIRILNADARLLIDLLPAQSLERIYILFPDPWPKARHHKRRLIQTDLIHDLARLLKPSGRLRFATDWADYANWTLMKILSHTGFQWTAKSQSDWLTAPIDHTKTRYETKQLGDCAPVFLDFTVA